VLYPDLVFGAIASSAVTHAEIFYTGPSFLPSPHPTLLLIAQYLFDRLHGRHPAVGAQGLCERWTLHTHGRTRLRADALLHALPPQMRDLVTAIEVIDKHLDVGGFPAEVVKGAFGLAELADDE
jgi:hypothetical protein